MDPCSLPVNAVVGGMGMYNNSILLVAISYSLFVLGHSLGHTSVYLVAVLARGMVYHSSGVFCFTLTRSCFRVF